MHVHLKDHIWLCCRSISLSSSVGAFPELMRSSTAYPRLPRNSQLSFFLTFWAIMKLFDCGIQNPCCAHMFYFYVTVNKEGQNHIHDNPNRGSSHLCWLTYFEAIRRLRKSLLPAKTITLIEDRGWPWSGWSYMTQCRDKRFAAKSIESC